jgi:hypothetical protein
MPKSVAKHVLCPTCNTPFKSQRALTMHLYHNKCGHVYPTQRFSLPRCLGPSQSLEDDNNEIPDKDDNSLSAVPWSQVFQLSPSSQYSASGIGQSTQQYSLDQQVHVELLHLLESAKAPDYLFPEIMKWAINASSRRYDFNKCSIPSRHHSKVKGH